MEPIIKAKNLRKKYGKGYAVNGVDLDIQPGRIVGLIGPNGAGKTTTLKGILGLCEVEGELSVLGKHPVQQRKALLEHVSFIADTAILPRWMRVKEALSYVEGVHPRFNREKAENFLRHTKINAASKISTLSKGMTTQLHLALIMAIDSKLLVLDEPTLGLDIIYRKQFYTSLLNDYYDDDKTILITTHQVEEIETILTDLIFINEGEIILNIEMDNIEQHFTELHLVNANKDAAMAHKPISVSSRLGGLTMIFENADQAALAELGSLHTPSISDLFVAKIQPANTWGSAQ